MVSTPGAKLWVRTSTFDHPINSAFKLIQRHPFNRKLQLILPVPEEKQYDLNVSGIEAFYYAIRATPSALIAAPFAQTSSSDSSLSCISLERSQPLAITPDRHLHLLICKDQYQQLGLVGALVGRTDTYHIDIDLASTKLLPGSPKYDRTNDRLKQSKDAVPLLCVQTQHGSIAEVDTAASGVLDTECLAHKHQHLKTSQVMAPKLEYMQQVARGAGDAGSVVPEAADALSATPMAALHDLYEWIGAVSCGIHGSSCLSIEEPHLESVLIDRHIWTGLLAPCQVQKALAQCRQLVADEICPWAVLSVWGFAGQPVSWLDAPVNIPVDCGGENDFSIVVLPRDQYMLMVASGVGDCFQTV